MAKKLPAAGSDFKVELKPDRTDVECKKCGDSMNASNSDFGTAMVAGFMKQHKCFKPRTTR